MAAKAMVRSRGAAGLVSSGATLLLLALLALSARSAYAQPEVAPAPPPATPAPPEPPPSEPDGTPPPPAPDQPPAASPQPAQPPAAGFDQLMAQLRAPDPVLRQGAANQLGQLADPRATPALISALNGDGEARVRAAAAYALGAMRAASAGQYLSRAAQQDPSPEVRDAASYALSQLGAGTYPPSGPGGQPRVAMTGKQLHRYLLETNDEYMSAKGRRTGGIVLTAVGGGLGLAIGAIAGLVYAVCDDLNSDPWDTHDDCATERNWMIGGFVGLGVSLAVGIPLIVSGSRRMNEIRHEYIHGTVPKVSLQLDGRRGGGRLGLTWTF